MLEFGKKRVLVYLQDEKIVSEFHNYPEIYYFVVFSRCIKAGIYLGRYWGVNESNPEDEDSMESLESFSDFVLDLCVSENNDDIQEYFPARFRKNDGYDFYMRFYKLWMELHAPYWKLADPREYTFNAMVAGVQLGISIVLEKMGY